MNTLGLGESTLPFTTSVLPLSTNTSSHTQRFKHGSQDARRRDSNYLFCFHLILASMENCRPRRGSQQPSEKRSGHCSWCFPAAAELSSGNEREAAAGHLREFISELYPKGAISAFRPCKTRKCFGKVQQASLALSSPHISSTPFTSRRTLRCDNALLWGEK